MKTCLGLLGVPVLLLAARGAGAGEKEDKNLPGMASWDLGALRVLFKVIKTEYDSGTRQVKWTLQTKQGQRTADFTRSLDSQPFTFAFLDEDMRELATAQLRAEDFKGLPGTRVMREGTRLTVTLDVPRAMPKVKRVVLRRGRGG